MALQIWMPLNGSLVNNGIADVEIINYGATVDNNGKIGKCYYFNGSSWIKIGLPSTMKTLKNTTICAWVKSANSIISLGGISHDVGANVACCTLYFNWQFADGNNWKYINCGAVADTFTWKHVAITIADNDITTYLNGKIVTTSSLTEQRALTTLTTSNFIEIGCDHEGGDEYLHGYVNDFRIYDNCLSAREVKEISKALVLHYPLNQCERSENLSITPNYIPFAEYGGGGEWASYELTVNQEEKCRRMTCVKTGVAGKYWYPFPNSVRDVSKIYTWSMDVRANREFSCLIGLECNGEKQYVLNSEWQRLQYTSTLTIDTINAFIIYPYGNATIGDWIEFKNLKIEEGNLCTPFCPSSADAINWNDNIEYDCSGFGNNGIIRNYESENKIKLVHNSPKYNYAYKLFAKGQYIELSNNILSCMVQGTISLWCKVNNIGNYGWLPISSGSGGEYIMATAHGIGKFYYDERYCPNQKIDKYYIDGIETDMQNVVDNQWHHYVITGVDISCWEDLHLYLNHYPNDNWNSDCEYADIRFYATALSDKDVQELYNTSVSITNNGTLMTQGEVIES